MIFNVGGKMKFYSWGVRFSHDELDNEDRRLIESVYSKYINYVSNIRYNWDFVLKDWTGVDAYPFQQLKERIAYHYKEDIEKYKKTGVKYDKNLECKDL